MAETLWDAITRRATDFIEGGQERRQWLDDLGRRAEYYVPPELRDRIGLLGKALEFTDAGDMIAAEEASRDLWNNPSVGSAANYAAAGLGLALPVVSSRMMQEGVDVAGDAISSLADDARSIWSRLNQPGPVPTMNAIFPSGSSLDEVFGFVDKSKPIYHSGPADMAEEMQKWGVEPSYGPWVREIAAGAVDDVDEFLGQTPPAAWWSDQPDWIKMKVARAAKKPVSDVTVDDIRKHGHLAIASADDYSDVAFRIGDEGLDSGEYSFVEDLAGNRMRFYETPLYSEGNYPFGIERNEIVTGEAIEPAYSLTGDDLVKFMQRQGILSTDTQTLPAPRNEAEAMAKQVLEMRAAGRAGDVTEEMMAATDPQYMFANTPLPMDEASRMARARELGFSKEAYHGGKADFQAIDPEMAEDKTYGTGIWFTDNPDVAATYAGGIYDDGQTYPSLLNMENFASSDWRGRGWGHGREGTRMSFPEGYSRQSTRIGDIYEDWASWPSTDSAARAANQGELSGLQITDVTDIGPNIFNRADLQKRLPETAESIAVFDPQKVRSRFARFDPEFSHLRNLSAGVGGLGILSLLGQQEQEVQ